MEIQGVQVQKFVAFVFVLGAIHWRLALIQQIGDDASKTCRRASLAHRRKDKKADNLAAEITAPH